MLTSLLGYQPVFVAKKISNHWRENTVHSKGPMTNPFNFKHTHPFGLVIFYATVTTAVQVPTASVAI